MEGPKPAPIWLRALADFSLREGMSVKDALVEKCAPHIVEAATIVRHAIKGGHKILLCGNGGSAADAQHIAAELVGRFVCERDPLPAIALTVDTSILTAVGNDYGFDHVFSRQTRALGAKGDVLIAISTSGRSPNVLEACKAAREKGMKIVGLTGGKESKLAEIADVCIRVPSHVTSRIQECHIALGHLFCEVIDADLVEYAPSMAPVPRHHPKHLSLDEASALREFWRARGTTVVWTNGCFDVLHAGHLHSLAAARAHGHVLVVGLNSDTSVRALKGATRPVFPEAQRLAMLAALTTVDYVVVFEEKTPERVLGVLKPDVCCKGADYAPPDGAPIPEAKLIESYGGRIAFLPLIPGLSTTSTLARLAKDVES
jgi:phosphoheptose isomerase